MIAKLLFSVTELAQIWIKAKANEKQSLSDARAKRVLAAAESEQAWSDFMQQSSASGWKDEAWTLCFIVIVLACFIPPFATLYYRGVCRSGDHTRLVSLGDDSLHWGQLWSAWF